MDLGTFDFGFLGDKCIRSTIRIFHQQMFGMGSLLESGPLELALEKKYSVIADK